MSKMFKITVITLTLAVLAFLMSGIALYRYEKGLLDVCSAQQDNYVRLVLDQINLEKDRSDDEIINNILSTLNSSTSRYWTFSKGESILFVKDVLETDKYKSFSADNYYSSDSAKSFVGKLSEGRIIHDTIEVNDISYIASGTMFEYNGNEYELCLLTNETVFLDNNIFLSSKVELVIVIVFMICLLIVVPIVLTQSNERLMGRYMDSLANERELANTIVKLNAQLEERNIYDSRRNVFSVDLLDEFIDRLANRDNVLPIFYARILCTTDNGEFRLLDSTNLLFGKSAVRFENKTDDEYVILVLNHDDLVESEKEIFYNLKHASVVEAETFYSIKDLRKII
mgnify:CR=1 FL=1